MSFFLKKALNDSRKFSTSINVTKVSIFGGNGFLGKYLTKSFINDPFVQVQSISRSGKNSLGNLGSQVLPSKSGNITNINDVMKNCEGSSIIINTVGIMYSKGDQTYERVQVLGAENIAKAAKYHGAKLVHISAIGADPNSDIPYNRTKGLGEETIKKVYPESIILRPSLVFGPEDDFFNRFAKLAKYLPFLPIFGGGLTKFQPVYVWDIAKAAQLSVNGPFHGKTIELGGPTVYTYKEMMQLVLDQAGINRPIISLPWAIGLLQGAILEKLPPNLFTLTKDQVRLLKLNNIVSEGAIQLSDLGITPTSAERILPSYLRHHELTTPNKRTHKMVAQDLDAELERVRKLRASQNRAPPNLEKQLEFHFRPKPKTPKDDKN